MSGPVRFAPSVAAAIQDAAAQHGLEPALVAAIVAQESSGRPDASRYEPGWHYWVGSDGQPCDRSALDDAEARGQATSWSLMQIMGSVARELGFTGPFERLNDPVVGLHYGCLHLLRFVRNAISSYNAGHPIAGNQQTYVDPVLAYRAGFLRDGIGAVV